MMTHSCTDTTADRIERAGAALYVHEMKSGETTVGARRNLAAGFATDQGLEIEKVEGEEVAPTIAAILAVANGLKS